MNIVQSAIQEIGRQVREQQEAKRWCESHPYHSTMDEILAEERERRVLCLTTRDGTQS